MMPPPFTVRLRVRQIDQSCVFDLLSPTGQELSATLKYLDTLTDLYQNWRQIYRRRYELQARARVGSKSGSGTPASYDWDQELRLAETALLSEFDRWLGQAELMAVRETIQREVDRALQRSSKLPASAAGGVTILLECSPITLARLPWETWKLAPKAAPAGIVRIARTCAAPVAPSASVKPIRRSKIRIVAILAAAPDLNHELDQAILRSLQPLADIEWVQCQDLSPAVSNGTQAAELKQRVADAIADVRGWDVLFFAGHSDEAATIGGKLELAPHVALAISEIEPQLKLARQRGLQLALFNSCSGMHIAESLIRLGVPQVVVMRERIQDAVAHKFLQQFCHNLGRYQDVHTAMVNACQYFATETISYPSAYLIPSLFRHPDPALPLFRIQRSYWERTWQQWQPTRWEAMALGVISLLSLMVPVQDQLSDLRYWIQAVYRQTTHQLPPAAPPPVTLLKIDQTSIDRRGIDAYKIKPMSRAYLAELVDRLRQLHVQVVGVDYLLDGSTNEDPLLATAVQTAIQQQHTWFVFATRQNDVGQAIRIASTIAKPEQFLQGNIDVLGWNVMLPDTSNCRDCPFAYQLTIAQLLHADLHAPQPQIQPSSNLQQQVSQYLESLNPSDRRLAFLKQPKSPLGLQPVIDFSLPPNRVYQSLSAWDFLERPLDDATLKALQRQVVIIGSGGYDQADDNFPAPLAVRYWRSVKPQLVNGSQTASSQLFPGATAHAYMVHHLLAQHRLLWVPDLWLVVLAAALGKGVLIVLMSKKHPQRQTMLLMMAGATIGYGVISLQSYVSATFILPWLLPSALFWLYVLPAFRQQ